MPRNHLIILPCHGIWKINSASDDNNYGQLSDQWYLAPFQLEGNDHLVFIKQSLKAIEELLLDYENSVVLFSGSQTKIDAGPISEAQSYFLLMKKLINLATTKDGFEQLTSLFDIEIMILLESIVKQLKSNNISVNTLFSNGYINTEEYALDSFDNLLYSILRFKEITQWYPKHITIIGFGFKESRFLNYHARALDIPKDIIRYISYEPEPLNYSQEQMNRYFEDLIYMEKKNALGLFENDWYARKNSLTKKKNDRNPYKRIARYDGLKMFHFNEIKLTDSEHFKKYIEGKMPWSYKE